MTKKKETRFTVCCDPSLHERLKEVAQKNNRPLSGTAAILLERALEMKLDQEFSKML